MPSWPVERRSAQLVLNRTTMGNSTHYVIRGGIEGRERLRVLARVMHSSSSALFDRLGLHNGLSCLDLGCGGGDVTMELARRVAPLGRVFGVDIDTTKLDIARKEAAQLGVTNVSFEEAEISRLPDTRTFDLVYARFLLTHLSDPASAVSAFYRQLRPGGIVAVEDIDFSGYFTYPESWAFRRYHALYCATVRKRGGDPDIGPRLPGLLKRCGFEDVKVQVVQPVSLEGESKLITPITMENIVEPLLEDGMATRDEIDRITDALYRFAADPTTLAGMPRVVQAWGQRPRHRTQSAAFQAEEPGQVDSHPDG